MGREAAGRVAIIGRAGHPGHRPHHHREQDGAAAAIPSRTSTRASPEMVEARAADADLGAEARRPTRRSSTARPTSANGWNARSQFYKDQSKGALGAVLPQEGSVFQINIINLVERHAEPDGRRSLHQVCARPGSAEVVHRDDVLCADQQEGADQPGGARPHRRKFMERMIPLDWIAMAKLRDRLTEQWRRQVLPASR